MTLIDTSALSLSLRRSDPEKLSPFERSIARELASLIAAQQFAIIGAVRQEVLTGIRDEVTFVRLRTRLRNFPDTPCLLSDFELGAEYANACRRAGVQGSPVDYLVCAVAVRLATPILASDGDFATFARHLPIELHPLTPGAV